MTNQMKISRRRAKFCGEGQSVERAAGRKARGGWSKEWGMGK